MEISQLLAIHRYYLEKPPAKTGIDNRKALETNRAKEAAEKAAAERRLRDAKNKEAAAEKADAQQRLRDAQAKKAVTEKATAEQKIRDALEQKEAEKAARTIRRKEEEARKEAARKIRAGQSQNSSPKTATPPEGVPSILSWDIHEDGECPKSEIKPGELGFWILSYVSSCINSRWYCWPNLRFTKC
jgi:hypothetical protein